MDKKEWEKIGNSVRDIVENAVNSQDFQKLNQTISNVVSSAADNITGNIMRQTKYAKQQREQQELALQKEREKARLYINDKKVWSSGLGMVIPGAILGGIFGFGLLSLLLLMIIGEMFYPAIKIGAILLGVITFLLFCLVTGGRRKMKGIIRFRKYLQKLQDTQYCNLEDLAAYTGKSVVYIRKDIQKMIEKGWFREGHFDRSKTCFMTSDKVYEEYLMLEKQKQAVQAADLTSDQEKAEKKTAKKLSEEAQQIIQSGQDYIEEIRRWNDRIPGEEISRKISRMEFLVKKIFERIEQHPEQIDDIRRLLKYYLPTTVKLLQAYAELESQSVDTETIQNSKKEIEATLDTLNEAFEKMLDGLFQDTAWDVSSDISVLHTMLAQEGLTKNDFTERNK